MTINGVEYEVTIGLEIHIQLLTNSKLFSTDKNGFNVNPNHHLNEVTAGFPGTLPVLNKQAVFQAIKFGLACNGQISNFLSFDRKQYFYPDLPKGYQITQMENPIIQGGHIQILSEEQMPKIELDHVHLEEDAGKSIHLENDDATYIDLNRAGTPLLELVTKPCLHSAKEAAMFLHEVRKIVRFIGVSDGNMEEGSLRCDANISIKPVTQKELGARREIKNINSMKNLQKALILEIEDQKNKVSKGKSIETCTLGFDADRNVLHNMRTKEGEADYRYFPEPDLPWIPLKKEWIEKECKNMPKLPDSLFQHYTKEFGLTEYESLLLSEDRATSDYFNNWCNHTKSYKACSNWMLGPIKQWLNDHSRNMDEFPLDHKKMSELLKLIEMGKISYTQAQQKLFPLMLGNTNMKVIDLAEQHNLLINDSNSELIDILETVLKQNPEKVLSYRNGKKGIAGFFMGEIMKISKGKIDPAKAQTLLNKSLNDS